MHIQYGLYSTIHYEQYSDHSFFGLKFVTLFVAAKSLILFRSRAVFERHSLMSFTSCYGVNRPTNLVMFV